MSVYEVSGQISRHESCDSVSNMPTDQQEGKSKWEGITPLGLIAGIGRLVLGGQVGFLPYARAVTAVTAKKHHTQDASAPRQLPRLSTSRHHILSTTTPPTAAKEGATQYLLEYH